MNAYYYTFGTSPMFPYYGGWVKVYAETQAEADQKFRAKFPDRPGHEGILNCAFVYTQEEWAKKKLETWPKEWVKCWETIR